MARCVVTVVGIADRLTGISKKTGKDYDMQDIAITYKNKWGNNSVACATVDGPVIDQMCVQVGCRYDAVVNEYNGRTYVDLIDLVD